MSVSISAIFIFILKNLQDIRTVALRVPTAGDFYILPSQSFKRGLQSHYEDKKHYWYIIYIYISGGGGGFPCCRIVYVCVCVCARVSLHGRVPRDR